MVKIAFNTLSSIFSRSIIPRKLDPFVFSDKNWANKKRFQSSITIDQATMAKFLSLLSLLSLLYLSNAAGLKKKKICGVPDFGKKVSLSSKNPAFLEYPIIFFPSQSRLVQIFRFTSQDAQW